jgi:hypothetical protein
MALWAQGTVFGFFFLGYVVWCHLMPCHFVSGSKGWNQFSSPIMILWKKSQPLTIYHFVNCEETFSHWSLCSSISKRETDQAQTSRYPKLSTISWTALCPIPISAAISLTVTCWFSLMGSLIFALFLSVGAVLRSPLQSYQQCLCSHFEAFYPLSDIARVHAGISICILKSCKYPMQGFPP